MLPLASKSQSGEIKLILASGSARRKLLLETAGFKFECVTSNFPEDLDKSNYESAIEYVRATCLGKLESLPPPPSSEENIIQIACDTVVVRPDGVILEKPANAIEAFEMISSLLGKRIKVISVVHLRSSTSGIKCFHEESELIMRTSEEISENEIKGYLEEVNYTDLAGGLAVQSCGMIFVKSVIGCYNNVMGFPISLFYQELKEYLRERVSA